MEKIPDADPRKENQENQKNGNKKQKDSLHLYMSSFSGFLLFLHSPYFSRTRPG